MTLLQPSYLWGLLALAIPIAIHLWSRKKLRTIKVGSTKFIAETKSKQSNSIRLNEWWLLLLRCLIIGTLIFILAEPHTSKTESQQDITYIFEPSLLATAEGRARFTQIPKEGRRLLRSGFPEWQEEEESEDTYDLPNYWQLAQRMVEIPADSIVVFTHAFAKAVKGKRPEVQANINWIPVDIESTVTEPFLAIAKKDSVTILTANSDATGFAYAKRNLPKSSVSFNSATSVEVETVKGLQSIPVQHHEVINVSIVYDKKEDAQRMYLEAAFRAIGKYTDRDFQVAVVEDLEETGVQESDYLVFLSNLSPPDVEIPTLLYRPDALANELIEPGNTESIASLTQKLTPRIVVEEQLVIKLLEWLQLNREIESTLDTLDKRMVSVSQLETTDSYETNRIRKLIEADISGVFWIVLLIMLLGERILAKMRKQ